MSLSSKSLLARRVPLAAPQSQLQHLATLALPEEFHAALAKHKLWPLKPSTIRIFQMNLGKLCNQTCRHCHVDAGPDRQEVMSQEVMQQCLDALSNTDIPIVDITGGAPELTPHFRWLVQECKKLGRHVIDRCNLTIMHSPKYADLPEFFAKHRVEVVCSLPHYRAQNTDKQRGDGVFDKSITALRQLNALGYGDGKSGLRLVLVANPVGAFLPPPQATLEAEWKRELERLHGIHFDALYTITNMPISRYLEWLLESGNFEGYMSKLVNSFNPHAAGAVMCRDTLSVDWRGYLYDCDFNQMLDIGLDPNAPKHISDFNLELLSTRNIQVNRHCFGCTAGSGSSCGGATA